MYWLSQNVVILLFYYSLENCSTTVPQASCSDFTFQYLDVIYSLSKRTRDVNFSLTQRNLVSHTMWWWTCLPGWTSHRVSIYHTQTERSQRERKGWTRGGFSINSPAFEVWLVLLSLFRASGVSSLVSDMPANSSWIVLVYNCFDHITITIAIPIKILW